MCAQKAIVLIAAALAVTPVSTTSAALSVYTHALPNEVVSTAGIARIIQPAGLIQPAALLMLEVQVGLCSVRPPFKQLGGDGGGGNAGGGMRPSVIFFKASISRLRRWYCSESASMVVWAFSWAACAVVCAASREATRLFSASSSALLAPEVSLLVPSAAWPPATIMEPPGRIVMRPPSAVAAATRARAWSKRSTWRPSIYGGQARGCPRLWLCNDQKGLSLLR